MKPRQIFDFLDKNGLLQTKGKLFTNKQLCQLNQRRLLFVL